MTPLSTELKVKIVTRKNIALNSKLKLQTIRCRFLNQELLKCKHHYRKLLTKSEIAHKRTQVFSEYLLIKNEEDRKEISRELHDEVSQVLTGINFQLEILSKEAATSSGTIRKKIGQTQTLVEKSVETIHRFAKELRPMVLDDLGLIAALKSFIKEFTARTSIPVELTTYAPRIQLSDMNKTILFRVAQEAITNVGRHSEATKAMIVFTKHKDHVQMDVIDNGKHFDSAKIFGKSKNKRLGLLGMEERVRIAHGHFEILSSQGKGTVIRVQIPFMVAKKFKHDVLN